MNSAAALRCRCDRPIRDGDDCLKCGRPRARINETACHVDRAVSPYAVAVFHHHAQPSPRRWPRNAVLDALLAFEAATGLWPTHGDVRRRDDLPSASVVERLFGSWDAGIRAAALAKVGRLPTDGAMGRASSTPTANIRRA